MAEELQLVEVDTAHCGKLKVFVQGNLAEKQGKTIFLTIHDMGTNHRSFVNFVNDPSMAEVKARSIFLHVCVPGQEDNAAPLAGDFPTLQQMGEDLNSVLEKVDVKSCIVIGEGAGANIAYRFTLAHPNSVMGVALIHCTSTTAGVLETLKDKVINWQMSGGTLSQAAHEYLVFHKFGPGQGEKKEHVAAFVEDLQKRLNITNLSKYLESFQQRTSLSAETAASVNIDSLLVVGSKASHIHTVYTMHKAMPKDKSQLLVIDGVGDVLTEAPDRFTRALILFCKGSGVLSGVGIPGMERQRTLSSSMEEADRPRRASLTGGSPAKA